MAKSHVLSGLVTKHQEISGEIAAYQEQINKLNQSLSALTQTIKLFAPEYDLRTISPKRTNKQNAFFVHGERQRMILEILRDAAEPCTTRQIVEQILLRKKLEASANVIEELQKMVGTACRSLERRTLVQIVGKDGIALLWQLV